jgi:hypothetical protein
VRRTQPVAEAHRSKDILIIPAWFVRTAKTLPLALPLDQNLPSKSHTNGRFRKKRILPTLFPCRNAPRHRKFHTGPTIELVFSFPYLQMPHSKYPKPGKITHFYLTSLSPLLGIIYAIQRKERIFVNLEILE